MKTLFLIFLATVAVAYPQTKPVQLAKPADKCKPAWAYIPGGCNVDPAFSATGCQKVRAVSYECQESPDPDVSKTFSETPFVSKRIAMSINHTDAKHNHRYSVDFGVEIPGKTTKEIEVSIDGKPVYSREQTQARVEWSAAGWNRYLARDCAMEIIAAVEFPGKTGANYIDYACKPSQPSTSKEK